MWRTLRGLTECASRGLALLPVRCVALANLDLLSLVTIAYIFIAL